MKPLFLLLVLVVAAGTTAQPLRIATDLWPGSGMLYVAREKGYFVEEGLDVDLVFYDDYSQTIEAFIRGEVDAVQEAVCDAVTTARMGKRYVATFCPADNNGFNLIIGRRGITDIRGKRVGYRRGTIGHFLLLKMLAVNHLTENDIIPVDCDFSEGLRLFESGEIDIVAANDFQRPAQGRPLFSTIGTNHLPNVFLFSEKVIETRRDQVLQLMRAWQKAVEFRLQEPDSADAIMTRALGVNNQKIFNTILMHVPILDLPTNVREYFGPSGEIMMLVREVADFQRKNTNPTPAEDALLLDLIENTGRSFDSFLLDVLGYRVPTFTMGVINFKGRESIFSTYRPVASYVAGRLGERLGMAIRDSLVIVEYSALAYPLKHNQIDIGVFSPWAYIDSRARFPELRVFADHIAYGKQIYNAVIAVKARSDMHALADLRGKRLLFIDTNSTSGYQVPCLIMRREGLSPEVPFLASVGFAGSHDAAIERLANGDVDAIATYEEAFQDTSLVRRFHLDTLAVRFLYRQEVPNNAYVLSPGMETLMKKYVTEIMYEAHTDPATADVLQRNISIQRWEPCGDDRYNTLRALFGYELVMPSLRVEVEAVGANSAALREQTLSLSFTVERWLADTRRFLCDKDVSRRTPYAHILHVSIQETDSKHLRYELTADGAPIGSGTLPASDLIRFPALAGNALCAHIPLETIVLRDAVGLYIPAGRNNGIDERYVVERSSEVSVAGAARGRIVSVEERTSRVTFDTDLPDRTPVRLRLVAPRDQSAIPPPAITILEVVDGDRHIDARGKDTLYITGNSVTISGTVRDSLGVYRFLARGNECPVAADGSFRVAVVKLAPEGNPVTLTAFNTREVAADARIVLYLRKPEVDFGDYYALLVAVQNYDDSTRSLRYPISDMTQLRTTLLTHYRFDSTRIMFLRNPAKVDLLAAFDSLRSVIGDNDNLLICYAGHGDTAVGAGWFLLRDAKSGNSLVVRSSWVQHKDLCEMIRQLRARHVLLVSDACYSGDILAQSRGGEAPELRGKVETPSRMAMTSGAHHAVPDRSIFMRRIIEQLERNEEEIFPSADLFYAVRTLVMNDTDKKQEPLRGDIPGAMNGAYTSGGDFIFVRRKE